MYQAIEKHGLIHRRVELIRKNATEAGSKSHLCDKYRVGEKYSALRKSFIRESSEAATLIAWSRSRFRGDGKASASARKRIRACFSSSEVISGPITVAQADNANDIAKTTRAMTTIVEFICHRQRLAEHSQRRKKLVAVGAPVRETRAERTSKEFD
jgi:hypothetical protein